MPIPSNTTLGLWTGRSTFFWAAAAATIGLGNLWYFPWLASQFGGGYFILMYLGCLLLVALPLILAESSLGRHSRHNISLAIRSEAEARRLSPRWAWVGRMGVLSGFLVLSITLVIGSICLAYVFYGALGHFREATPVTMAAMLGGLVESSHDYRGFMAWHLLFVGLVGAVAFRQSGVEWALRIIMPVFLLLLAIIAGWSYSQGLAGAALEAVAGFRWQDVGIESAWFALSNAFYTLGIGLGVWAVLGALMSPGTPLKRSVLAVALLDTLVGVVAGVVIYSIAQAMSGVGDARGFGLVFVALPVGLGGFAYHQLLSTGVFAAILLVAWTSALVLVEAVVGWLREWVVSPRPVSALIVLVFAWLVGLVTLFSFNIWSDMQFAGLTPFRWIELVTSGLLIPLVAAALAIFLGWLAPVGYLAELLGGAHPWLARLWHFVLRYLLPPIVVAVGLSYSVASLRLMCENGNLLWCGPSAHELSAGEQQAPSAGPVTRSGPGRAADF